MPTMDGIEATRWVKREFPDIPVLVMNTLGAPDQLLEALEAEAAGYVRKRSGSKRIRDAVRGALLGEYPLDEELPCGCLGAWQTRHQTEEVALDNLVAVE